MGVDLAGNPQDCAFVALVVLAILLISTVPDQQGVRDLLRLATVLIWTVTGAHSAERKPRARRRT
ncbi:hypothetical protein ABTY61_22995 [Kitasatospora sp. NPDC096128]|uniref:hypothetical protein n=1 Tax=Kitasatospora sp. NPDC096128 TaxID=3155547 RepID=UPI0033197CD8